MRLGDSMDGQRRALLKVKNENSILSNEITRKLRSEAEGGKRNGGTALQFPSNLFLAMACERVP